MSDEIKIILDLSFDNQTVTDLTGNWTLDDTPNATYEQIEGRDGYSIVTRSLGRCIALNAVDQNAVYNEYTVDFDMFVKSTYTPSYYASKFIYLWSRVNPGNGYYGYIGNVLDVYLQIGGSERIGTTDYSPIGRWVHVTLTSGLTEVADHYCTTVYVDGVKLIDRTDHGSGVGVNPFALSQQILLLTRDTNAKLMPNGPGICLNTFKVVAGIHAPDQKPAISLLNLSRVFNNFCTWLKGQLSTVALTGSYNDLSDKPTSSTVNDGTLTIQKNGTNVATFTANQSTAATANITVPTKTSDLTNDSGFITSDNTKIPLTGTSALAGSIVPSTDNAYDLGDSTYGFKDIYTNKIYLKGSTIFQLVDDNFTCVCGATAQANGANLVLNGKNRSTNTGAFKLEARDGTNVKQLIGKPDGNLLWSGTTIVRSDNNAVMYLGSGTFGSGSYLQLNGENRTNDPGYFSLIAKNSTNIVLLQGTPNGTLMWDGQPIQTASDQRLKQQITQIDDDLLTAWEDVELSQFKYNDAVDQKKDKARLHTGYVVQQIDEACKSHGVDISAYGLYCHEEYAEETREVEHEDGTKTIEVVRPASEHYSLRYTEALIVECAYLRKKLKELTARIEQLEKGNNTK